MSRNIQNRYCARCAVKVALMLLVLSLVLGEFALFPITKAFAARRIPMYKQHEISDFVGMDGRTIRKKLGKPVRSGNGTAESEEFPFDAYNNITFEYEFRNKNPRNGKCRMVSVNTKVATVDDITLDKTRLGIIRIMGQPSDEGYDDYWGDYRMSYNLTDSHKKRVTVTFLFEDSHGESITEWLEVTKAH